MCYAAALKNSSSFANSKTAAVSAFSFTHNYNLALYVL